MTKKEKQKECLSAVAGLEKMAVRGLNDCETAIRDLAVDLFRIENMAVAVFNAMIENGVVAKKAVDSLEPVLSAIKRKREILVGADVWAEQTFGVDTLLRMRGVKKGS